MPQIFQTTQIARPAYYDRNPTQQSIAYGQDANGPTAPTVRASYTVPAGKKAYSEGIALSVLRITAPTVGDRASMFARYTKSGGVNQVATIVRFFNNAADTNRSVVFPGYGLMSAGDILELITSDASTNGTVDYYGFAKITEFDG